MLYYLRANVTLKVPGISGPFNDKAEWLVNANNPTEAKSKFEEKVKRDHAHMQFNEVRFEYTNFAGEIP